MVTRQGFIIHINIADTVNIFKTASELGATPQTEDRGLHWAAVFLVLVTVILPDSNGANIRSEQGL